MAPTARSKTEKKSKGTKPSKHSIGKVKKISHKLDVLKGSNVWQDGSETNRVAGGMEMKPLFTVNEKGQKVKEFKKQGVQRPWIDIKYEENDRMTFYDGFYVKKDAVEELDTLKRSFELEGYGGEKVKIKMMKPLRKANRILFKELLYEQKFKQIKEGTYTAPAKVWSKKDSKDNKKIKGKVNQNSSSTDAVKSDENEKDKPKEKKSSKKPAAVSSIEGLELNFQISDNEASDAEDQKNTEFSYNGVPYSFVETNPDRVEESDDLECSEMEEDEGIKVKETEQKSSTKTKKSGKDTKKLDLEPDSSDEGIEVAHKSGDASMEVDESLSSESEDENDEPQIEFKENSLMTCVEGIWVRRSKLDTVASLREAKKKEVIMARPGGDDSPILTEEETAKYKSALKIELNKLSNQLLAFLRKVTKKNSLKNNAKKNAKSKKCRLHRSERKALKSGGGGIGKKFQKTSNQQNFRGVDKRVPRTSVHTKNGLVNFRGYWIKPDGAKRLHELENRLKAEGTAKERIAELIKVERRREENEQKRERRQVCFSCRKTGHMVADCPLKRNTQGVGACFKCGSLEHQSDGCVQSEFSYATCFICRQKGHISRECPKNSKGLYPHGGGCTLCDSNQHLIKDCPRNTEERKEREELKAGELKAGQLLEVVEDNTAAAAADTSVKKKSKNKVVKF